MKLLHCLFFLNANKSTPLALGLVLSMLTPVGVQAQTKELGEEPLLPRVDVIGTSSEIKFSQGSAHIIDASELEQTRAFSVSEALRKVPGVHVRDEEGLGLRPNIGIRGMNPTRSTKVLLLEDGMPLSFAPYGDNASYYHPPIDRYDSIEVSKGSQVLRFGPQTAGGVINYITPEPQKTFGGLIGLAAGSRGYLNGHLMVTGNGAILDAYRKESDGARDNVHSAINDLNFKWSGDLNSHNKLILRATHYDENSTNTYSGLTEKEFARQGARYNPFKNDQLDFKRTGLSATNLLNLGQGKTLTTSIYGAQFDRNWWRQASSTLDCPSGTTRINGDVLAVDGCQVNGRLRSYTTLGIDSRVQQNHTAFGMSNQLEYGIKVHSESQERKQLRYADYSKYLNGDTSGLTSAHVQEDQKRTTMALSSFVANRFEFSEQFAVTPIIRIENIRSERIGYLAGEGRGKASLTEVIPGVGASYRASSNTIIYGGVHKGFSPARVEDAIDSVGGTVDLNPERSVNMELGLRTSPTKDSFIDVALFRNDFSNNVQVGSIAGGGANSTSTNYSEGKALYQGIEFAGQMDKLTSQLQGNLFVRAALTYLPTAEQRSAFNRPNGVVEANYSGKRLPYVPEHQATITLGYQSPKNWNTRVEYVYVGRQFSDFANTATVNVNGDGRTGPIDAYGIWNATVNYTVGKATLFVAGKNLVDHTYIVDRTRGILVGMPRIFQAGVKYAF